MYRKLLATTCMYFCLSAPAFAACAHYAGHFDLEGKIGNTRNLGEASAFLPIACTQDRLLFTDLKFRADNLSNREANIGIGGRLQREDGIAGGYIYFDRKKSGETDKFYTQITTGAEWLADHWETRANIYIPLNGAKNVSATTTTSNPYLAGSNIFIDQAGFVVKETPMYGADAEIGFQTTENLWLYGGGFTFHGNDVPTITGARVRAKYDLTQTVSLNAEGQYDDERGRQGWLGARLSVPFGNVNATRSRMTQSPVRDVDIVTQAKTTFESQTTTALANPDSGDAQRVIYVDNRAATNGDGSLENPYSTLADAQGDLRDYDIVYVFHGDGTTTGQDQGFVIDKNNVSFIGEGSPLTFAGYTLRAAGDKPSITHSHAMDPVINILNANATISGFKIDDAIREAINLSALSGLKIDYVRLSNLDIVTQDFGIRILSRDAGSHIGEVLFDNINVTGGNSNAFRIFAEGDGFIGTVNFSNVSAVDSAGVSASAINISAGSSSHGPGYIEKLYLSNVEINNRGSGLQIRSREVGSVIKNVVIENSIFSNSNYAFGVWMNLAASGVIESVDIKGTQIFGNTTYGLGFTAASSSSLLSARVSDSDIVNNQEIGIRVIKNTTGPYELSLNGNNRMFGNGQSNPSQYGDIYIDLDDSLIPLDARNNWWGQEEGPVAGQIRPGVSPNGGSADGSDWLKTDPRP